MEKFLFLNVIVSSFNIFVIVYAYSLNFFPKKWRKKINQDTLVGLALIFSTRKSSRRPFLFLTFKIKFEKPETLNNVIKSVIIV